MTDDEIKTSEAIARPLVLKLLPVANKYPDVAETVIAILTRTVDMVAKSGRPGDVRVWERGAIAAASEYASEHTAERWLAMEIIRGE